jgi:uncharacterized membrane protein YecN with MAPEG domain
MGYLLTCAGLLGLVFIGLSLNVVRNRRRARVSLGDGGDAELLKAIRAHANFIEYVPMSLILIYTSSWVYGFRTIACLSVLLLLSRIAHAVGILGGVRMGRFWGSIGTAVVVLIASILTISMGLGIKLY